MSEKRKITRRRVLTYTASGLLILSGTALASKTIYETTSPSEQDNVLKANAQKIEQTWKEETSSDTGPISEPDEYKNGEIIGVMRIPAWGPDHAVPIISGTSQDNLEYGVGHYDDSARAGQKGNFAVAGHRSGDPQPFRRLLELEVGDEVVVETEAAIYTYVVTEPATETTVRAVDGGWTIVEPDVKSDSEYTMTLTTCTHFYRSLDRSVLFADLKETRHKTMTWENSSD